MAQPAHIEIKVDATEARRHIKRVIADAQEANRIVARLEDRLEEVEARLAAAYGIGIRKESTSE